MLVVEGGIPADLAIIVGHARGDALGGELDADGIVVGNRGDKAQVLQAVVRQNGTWRLLYEEACGPGDQEVTVCDAAWEEGVRGGGLFVGVGVEGITG